MHLRVRSMSAKVLNIDTDGRSDQPAAQSGMAPYRTGPRKLTEEGTDRRGGKEREEEKERGGEGRKLRQ